MYFLIQEALGFMMDHTEGFEDEDEETGEGETICIMTKMTKMTNYVGGIGFVCRE